MEIKTDFLVIGSGIGGLSFALKASELGDVVIVTKKEDSESNTNYAQGGIASVLAKDDSFDLHVEDTQNAGAGLCDPEVVRKVVEAGPGCIKELIQIGVNFTTKRGKEDEFDLGLEGGHSKNRVVHAADLTGISCTAHLPGMDRRSSLDRKHPGDPRHRTRPQDPG